MNVVSAVRPYQGPTDEAGLVDVYDIRVDPSHVYAANRIYVGNSKRVALLDVNALISHGAVDVLRDAKLVRGQRKEDQWMQFMSGYGLPPPTTPFVYDQFLNQLRGGGVNVTRNGPRLNVMALTGRDVDQMAAGRVLRNADTVRFDKNLEAVPGGLFDPSLTGGHGDRGLWAKIPLHEPVVNPVMEEPARRLLGLTQAQYEEVIAGKRELPKYGTGFEGIAKALKNYDLPRELERANAEVQNSRGNTRDQAVRRRKYLEAAQRLNQHPSDWLWDAAPVIPPAFRPVSVLGSTGVPLVADVNALYKDVMEANANLKGMKTETGEQVGPERLALYHALKAVTGLGEPVSEKNQERGVRGLLKSVFGGTSKFSTMQRKLLSYSTDNVGRGVVAPDPDLDMDEIGIPEDQAFEVFGRYVARRLKRRGLSLRQALTEIKDQTPLARSMLSQEMEERPVIVNRAPVLHKFGILAFKPKLVSGDTIKVPPLVVKGFNMDFDGDAVQFHAPATAEAVREAYDKMLPSRNLLSPADFKSPVHTPSNEYVAGLHEATVSRSKKPEKYFASKAAMLAAHRRGELSLGDPVVIADE